MKEYRIIGIKGDIAYNLVVDISEYNLKDTVKSTTVPSDVKMFVQQREIGKWTALDDEKPKEVGLRGGEIMITKEFGKDFNSEGGALTLTPDEVTEGNEESGIHQRTHEDGWTVKGEIHEAYYTWVNDFEASHPKFGRVWGDFEDKVYADSEEGFKDFYEKHTPEAWDYQDI